MAIKRNKLKQVVDGISIQTYDLCPAPPKKKTYSPYVQRVLGGRKEVISGLDIP